MHWNVSNRVQIVEDYKTLELSFNRTIELPYTEHEAECENLMGVINRWLERKNKASKNIVNARNVSNESKRLLAYYDDYREAKMCYEYNLRELDHLIRHNSIVGAERIHSDCETCDKIETTNAILKRPWLAQV